MSYPYGANRNVKIFIGSDDPETRKEFSDLCGQKKVKNFSVNTNAENPASSNTGASNQPLITVGMLERLNGDEKGDAIVSVRGYEPIWTKFTPSYKLKGIYFAAGKADISKREARLFEKENFVFDIAGNSVQSEEEKLLERLERREKEEAEQSEVKQKEKTKKLDEEWESIKNQLDSRIKQLAKMLEGKDANALLAASYEYKTTVLFMIMENYNQTIALKIQALADYISGEALPKMKELQEKAL